jgi:hypothetical protein
MNDSLYQEFVSSDDKLRVYSNDTLIFSSRKERLLPLLDYLEKFADSNEGILMFDKVVGNAAALLMIEARCGEVYSPIGSELAAKSLQTNNIQYYFNNTVPYIQRASSAEMCPMEELSLCKSPAEFLIALKACMR